MIITTAPLQYYVSPREDIISLPSVCNLQPCILHTIFNFFSYFVKPLKKYNYSVLLWFNAFVYPLMYGLYMSLFMDMVTHICI